MNIEENEKINIILNLLKERYHASHIMRERSLKFVLWILGFDIVAFPWLLFNSKCMSPRLKWSLTFTIFIIGFFTFIFLAAIDGGFKKNRKIIIRMETALGCYEKGYYMDSEQLFPEDYKKFRVSWRYHFASIYLWIFISFVITVFFIWFKSS